MATRVRYTGPAPGADSNSYVLFSTVAAGWSQGASQAGGRRVLVDLRNSQDGTLKLYKSEDRGVTWVQVEGSLLRAITTATHLRDWLVEPYPDWKLEWANGGAAQATWSLSIAISSNRHAVATAPPACAITSPAASATVYEGKALTITGTCYDRDAEVSEVEVFLGAASLGTATIVGDTWSLAWTPTSGQVGAGSLTAVATDDAGQSTTSAAVSITIGSGIARVVALAPVAFYFGDNVVLDGDNAEAGDQVAQWTDLSGNGYHATQSTQDDQPTLVTGTDDYLMFDSGDGTNGDHLVSTGLRNALSAKAAITAVSAYRATDLSASRWLINGDNTDFGVLVVKSAESRCYLSGGHYAIGPAKVVGTDYIDVWRYDGAGAGNEGKVTGSVNGVAITPTFSGTIPTAINNLTGASAMTVGNNATTWAGLTGRLYAQVFFDRAPSTADLAELDAALKYLLAWYGAL